MTRKVARLKGDGRCIKEVQEDDWFTDPEEVVGGLADREIWYTKGQAWNRGLRQ